MSQHFLKIGLSLPQKERSQLLDIRTIPECFELLELPGELAAEAPLLRSEQPLFDEFEFFNFRNLIDSSLTCQLTRENQVIVQEYKKQLRELFAVARQSKAETVSIDPDWETLLQDAERMRIFDDVLRSTAGDREFYQLTVTLAVRMPGSNRTEIVKSLDLLHKLANYRVKLSLDIHPHELLNCPIDWESLLNHFRFDASDIRFCYASELGNKLLYKHIEPIINGVKKWQYPLNIYLAPSGRADLNELAEMIKSVNQELPTDESQR